MSNKAILYYMTVNDFFMDFMKKYVAKENKKHFEIVIVSKDIITDNQYIAMKESRYISNYTNINFANDLRPCPEVKEYLYNSSEDDFAQRYKTQLSFMEPMTTLCSIVDLVINDDTDVILLCSYSESKSSSYMDILCDFIYDNFGIMVNKYKDTKDKDDIEFDPGDYERAQRLLEFQIQNQGLVDRYVGTFFNKFTKDMADDYRKILMSKSIDELSAIGANRNLYINRHKPKEYIVDHILKSIMDDREYTSDDV